MRAILIDPFTRTVSLVEYTGGLASLHALLHCRTISSSHFGGGIFGYVDDEAMLKLDPAFFAFGPTSAVAPPIPGRMLMLNSGPEGEDMPLPDAISVQLILRLVSWVDRADVERLAEQGAFDARFYGSLTTTTIPFRPKYSQATSVDQPV